jgi:hypothetical protein
MLDEDQQRHNFRTKLNDGREVSDDVKVFSTVKRGLQAVVELHKKRPDLDLSVLYPAIGKLTQSPNPAMQTEAVRTKIDLGIQS